MAKTSKYFGVMKVQKSSKNAVSWSAILHPKKKYFNFKKAQAHFHSEKEAAIQVDKWLIERGEQPVNILKPKQ